MKKICVIILCLYAKRVVSHNISTCGIDNEPQTVSEGPAEIDSFPWMGFLIYPYDADEPQTSTVVLITRQLVLATALEVDKFPKVDFREKSRVVLGHNCSQGPHLRVLEYAYHPDFNKNYYSSLAIVQIKPSIKQVIMPICSPPKEFNELEIYAMTLIHDCSRAMARVYKMEYVELNECRDYYRRNDLNVESLWPKHVSCAKSLSGGTCQWQSGTVLVTKQQGIWRLLGVGVYGPGCEAPSRFLDYGGYHGWVAKTVSRVGRVAVTRMDRGHLILRRSYEHIERFGPCDLEEIKYEIYSETTKLVPPTVAPGTVGLAKYNLTLLSKADYSCIILRLYPALEVTEKTWLRIHRWCQTNIMMCGSANSLSIFFNIVIFFERDLKYTIRAFGKEFTYIEAQAMLYRLNQLRTFPPLTWEKYHGRIISRHDDDNQQNYKPDDYENDYHKKIVMNK